MRNIKSESESFRTFIQIISHYFWSTCNDYSCYNTEFLLQKFYLELASISCTTLSQTLNVVLKFYKQHCRLSGASKMTLINWKAKECPSLVLVLKIQLLL